MRRFGSILRSAVAWTALVCVAGVAAPLQARTQVGQQSAPAAPVKQLPDYRLGPQDVFTLNLWSGGAPQPDYGRPITVQNDGRVTISGIPEPVLVSGKTTREVEALIKARLIEVGQFQNPTVEVVVTMYRAFNITVQGSVRAPGRITMNADRMTLTEVIAQAGGLTVSAGTRIRIKAGPKRPAADPDIRVEDGWEIYSKDDLQEGRLSDVRLYEDDQVQVETAPKYYVNGQVKTPGDQQWEPNLTVERAIIKAGGFQDAAAKNRVQIRRLDPKTKKYQNIKMAKDRMSMIVEPDDIIEVPKKRW